MPDSPATIIGVVLAVVGLCGTLVGGLIWIVKKMFGLLSKMIEGHAKKMDEIKGCIEAQTRAAIENGARMNLQYEATGDMTKEITDMKNKIEIQNGKLATVIGIALHNRPPNS